jgi:hypothetical protein
MTAQVAASWRAFYLKAISGSAGYTATPEMYVIMYKAQLGRCFICQKAKGINPEDPKGKGPQRLGWDHNHATGAVRGLLCTLGQWSCNRIVGRYKDNPEAWRRGVRYHESPPALVLAQVQRLASDLPVEERIRIATAVLGVERETMEARVRQGRRGAPSSFVVLDEASRLEIGGVDVTPYVDKAKGVRFES